MKVAGWISLALGALVLAAADPMTGAGVALVALGFALFAS